MPNIGSLSTGTSSPDRLVFVDRDGVINEDPIGDYVTQWEEFRFIPGALEGLRRLAHGGFGIVIVSNQAGIGDGVFTKRALRVVTKKMLRELRKSGVKVRGVYYCVHGKNANCSCRKPKVGLFHQAARDLRFRPRETFFIGDKLSDMQAGKDFGFRLLFVLTGHGRMDEPKLTGDLKPEQTFPSLGEAADYVLGIHG